MRREKLKYSDMPHMKVGDFRPDGDQLELWPELLEEERELCWEGVSPRVLTAGYRQSIFKPQGVKKHARFGLTGQLELWPARKKAPRLRRGAPLLLELSEGGF